MNKINLLMALLGCFILAGSAFAKDNSSEFVGTWAGDFCTMDAKDGLHCGKPAEIIIDEQKEDLVRGHITINGRQYPLSGIINAENTIDYTDALGSIGHLKLIRENIIQMRTLNRCVKGENECAHKGIFKKKMK